MKKLFLFCFISLFTALLSANPVYRPNVFLDSLSFDTDGHWTIALFIGSSPDSIKISSSSGWAVYKGFAGYENLTLTADSLDPYVPFDPEGDSVTIISYFLSWDIPDSLTETIVFGDYRGAVIPKPSQGQSIIRIFPDIMETDYHCLRGSSGSTTGILHGKIYDKDDNPVKAGSFCLSPFPVYLNCPEDGYGTDGFDVMEDGTYSIPMYAIIHTINSIGICSYDIDWMCVRKIYWTTGSVEIDTVYFVMLPDSSVQMDVHLLGDYSNIYRQEQPMPGVMKIYPNPVIDGRFNYEVSVPVKSAKCFFVLFDASGRKVWECRIPGNTGEMDLPSSLSGGIYILQARMNEKTLAALPLVIKR